MLGPSPWIIKHAVLFTQQGAQGLRGDVGDSGENGLTVSTRQLTRSSMLATINKILNTLTNYNYYNVSSKNRNIDIRITLDSLDGNF